MITQEDTHFVFSRPKHYTPSHGSTWANEDIRCSHLYPQKFEVDEDTQYTTEFRSVCRVITNSIFYFLDTSEKKYIERVKKDPTFLGYEKQRVLHLERFLDHALSTSTNLSRDEEVRLFACHIVPSLKSIKESLPAVKNSLVNKEKLEDILNFHEILQNNCRKCLEIISEFKLPNICPRVLILTDAGPGVGISNYEQRFRDAELARIQNSDYRIKIHRSREDSGQNEAERTNSVIGDAIPGDPKKYSCLIKRKMHKKRESFKIKIVWNYQ